MRFALLIPACLASPTFHLPPLARRFFAACWYAPQMAPPRREMEGAMRKTDSTFTKHTNSSFAAKNGNGGGSDSQRDVVGVAQVV